MDSRLVLYSRNQTSLEKIALDGEDIRVHNRDTLESDLPYWGFGRAYSRMGAVDLHFASSP